MNIVRCAMLAICALVLCCAFAFASNPAVAPGKAQPEIAKVSARTPPIVDVRFREVAIAETGAAFERAIISPEGNKPQPELSPHFSRKVTLHNKDEPVMRE